MHLFIHKLYLSTYLFIAKLNPAQSNSNSVGWAETALISTFTHPTQGKYQEGNFNTVIGQI